MTEEKKGDCYADGERKFMEWGQTLRHQMLLPILKILNAQNITANHLTILSLVSGLFAALLLPFNTALGLCLLLLHVLFDGMDGPLARYTNTASNRGSFTDSAADQLVIIAVILALVKMDHVDPLTAIIYVCAYTVVVGFAIVRNTLSIPYSWLVRPRFILYAWLPIEFWFFPHTLNMLMWVFNVLLLWKCATGFLKIRNTI